MAKRWSWDGCGRSTLAAGCLALLLAGCSLPLPQPEGPSLPATGGNTGTSAAPLALLPATIEGSSAGAAAPPVTVYFVLVDDGGRQGVRFGCNDSLVGSARTGSTGDARLKAAIGALLGEEQQPGGMYNALGGHRLKFLSGSFDGTTVTVYLAGHLKPGGTCDLSRIEAQLTQTALQAVGAVRADIYINGETLADYLKLEQVRGR
ncbi:hypothetical protein QFZ35_000897 [Arthrobacter ulcerisalmonis]|uniref:GerMN domain-containing protein n=1 Tax=Arthrobacter sp. B1I2 TaxID=3042263 RepID=UPI002786F747|nr:MULTISPECIES: GerMN domain-containing protein [Arthrobacter]MDQ0662399.1 hypothetical protein [Arthrobacter ulcerisalmonis]MDQ0730331.1 hypothetical protein [Arthrobacter sp. B1I2]